MSKSLKALQMAQQIAASAPKRVTTTGGSGASSNTNANNQNVSAAAGSSVTSSSSSSTRAAGQPNRVDYQVPEALKDIPPFFFQCTPLEKLIRQQPYLDFPEWCAKPSEEHTDARFEVSRPAPHVAMDPGQLQHFQPSSYKADDWTLVSTFSISRFPFYLVGKSQSLNDFDIDHPSVSRVHLAVVHHRSGKVCICDMHSSNGTFLNGRQIEKGVYVPISDGDQVRLGGSSRAMFLRLGKIKNQVTDVVADNKNAATSIEATSAASASAAIANDRRRQREDDVDMKQEGQDQKQLSTEAASVTNSVQPKKFPRTEADRVVLHHLLIKHKDVDGPVSKAPRNKGEQITRSADDANATAKLIRNIIIYGSAELSPEQQAADANLLLAGEPQTLDGPEKFFEAVAQHSECSSAKKKGLLGEITKEQPLGLEEFDEVALHLVPLEVSRVVKTKLGYHLLFRMPDN